MIALDLGTTTLAGRLFNSAGEVIVEQQVVNPQRKHGADILVRLQQAHDGDGEELQSLLVSGLRSLVTELIDKAGCTADDVTHLLIG